jgi:hypothetical protein
MQNEYAVLPSKRENGYRCFMLAYKKNDPFALMTIHILLSYAQNKKLGSKGLTIVFIGYDHGYTNHQVSLRRFLQKSNEGMNRQCSFTRDGMALDSEDKFNLLFGHIYKLMKSQIPEDYREAVKLSNLGLNETLFAQFQSFKNFSWNKPSPFTQMNYETKTEYNSFVSKILKYYLLHINSNQVVYNPYGIDGLSYDYEYNLNFLEIFRKRSPNNLRLSMLIPGSYNSIPAQKLSEISSRNGLFSKPSSNPELREFFNVTSTSSPYNLIAS